MIYLGKYKILKTQITFCDYEYVFAQIRKHIIQKKKLLISPLASQTLVEAYFNNKLKKILDRFDYLLPDSQWIRRSFNFLYGIKLKNRLYGPELMLKTCSLAQKEKYKIFLYGTALKKLLVLVKKLESLFPNINIAGFLPSKFNSLTDKEKKELIEKIERSKADILFIALGSPLQEIFAYELLYQNPKVKRPMIIMPVGAAFDFISGVKPQAPRWMQDAGFEWLFRLICEPARLWKRYLIYGPLFIFLVLFQKLSLVFQVKRNNKLDRKRLYLFLL